MQRKRLFLRLLPVAILVIVTAVTIPLIIRFQRRPVIDSLSSPAAQNGDELIIHGRFLGSGGDGHRVSIGGSPLTSSGILSWDDSQVTIQVPRFDGAVLIRIHTPAGSSKGVVLGDGSRLPRVETGPWLAGSPYIEIVTPSAGGPGTLVTLRGEGFGERRGQGMIWVNRDDEALFMGTAWPDLEHYLPVPEIALWSDREIRFWIPPGMNSGNIYVQSARGFSNPTYFGRVDGPGQFVTGEPIIWSLRQEVILRRLGTLPGNALYLSLPNPAQGLGQRTQAILDVQKTPLRRSGGVDLYRLEELVPDDITTVSRQLVVEVSPVELILESRQSSAYDRGRPEMESALGDDDWIKPSLVPRTASSVAGSVNGDVAQAEALYRYVVDLLDYSDEPPTRWIPDYITTRQADSEGYAFLFCSLARALVIPARPVGGLIVLDSGESRPWWWAEFWIEGLGWVTVDPALGDQADDLVLPGAGQDRLAYYFGNSEGRHVAFSRGVLEAPSQQPAPRLRRPETIYTLQESWEELSGNLESYVSSWPIPRITASY